jgi:hypothetical protein
MSEIKKFIIKDFIDNNDDKNNIIYFNLRRGDNCNDKNIYLLNYVENNDEIYKKKFILFTDSLVSDSETFNKLFYSSVFEKNPFKIDICTGIQLIALNDILIENKIIISNTKIRNEKLHETIKFIKLKKISLLYIFKENTKNFLSKYYFFFRIVLKEKLFKKIINIDSNTNVFICFNIDYKTYFPKELIKKKDYVINLNFFDKNLPNKNLINISDITSFVFVLIKNLTNFTNFLKFNYYFFVSNKKNFYLMYFYYFEFIKSLYGAIKIENDIYLNAFKNLNKKIKKNNKIFYSCEFSTWEFILNKNIENKNKYACFSSTIRFWVLNFFFTKKVFFKLSNFQLMPDTYLLNGKFQQKILNYLPRKKIRIVEASRYNYLLNYNNKIRSKKIKKNNVLILGDVSDIINKKLFDFSSKIFTRNKNYNFYFKEHPSFKIKSHIPTFIKTYNNKYNNLNLFQFFIISNTSMIIELLYLKKDIILINNNSLNYSPLYKYFNCKFYNEYNLKKNYFEKINYPKNYFYFDQYNTKWKAIINEYSKKN